jgi:hypothetical protein
MLIVTMRAHGLGTPLTANVNTPDGSDKSLADDFDFHPEY